MNRRAFLGLIGLMGCRDLNEDCMNISKKLWWMGGGGTSIPEYETLLFGATLSSLPTEFSISASFAFSGGVLNSTGTGANTGWDTYARWSYLSSQERQKIEVFFNINDVNSKFRVAKYNTNTWAKSGSVCEVDFDNSLLILYEQYLYPAIPSIEQQIPITVAINTAHNYSLSFSKKDLQAVIVLTNITTGETDTLTSTVTTTTSIQGVFRGQVALMHIVGDVEYTVLNYYTLNPDDPKIAVYGDSYVDGYSIIPDYEDRWNYRAWLHENGNALISGWGGNSSANLIERSQDWLLINPKNVILYVGYNENVLSTWKNNIETLIRAFVLKGSNVILGTYAPLTTVLNAANIAAMNAYILSRGYQYFDIGAVLTVGGDRTTLDASLILPDDTHPNVSGHNAIYNEYLTLDLSNNQRLNNGIIAYFNFDSDAVSETPLYITTLVNSPSNVAGILGNCYDFNGTTQLISIADEPLLSFCNASNIDVELTFSMWINVDSFAATNYIFCKRKSGFEYQLTISTAGKISLILFSSNNSARYIGAETTAAISLTTWTHVVVTYDASLSASGIKIYINGVNQSVNLLTLGTYVSMNNTSSIGCIGSYTDTLGAYNGKIDEVGIWRRKLTPALVTALYNGGSPLPYSDFMTTE